jgi:hypothetical protein
VTDAQQPSAPPVAAGTVEAPAAGPESTTAGSSTDAPARPKKGAKRAKGGRPAKGARKKRRVFEQDAEKPTRKRPRKKPRRRRDEPVRPSPPLQETDPLGAYLAGEMVPCPVGCGGFSEVVRVATLDSGAGEVWFECLSCAQRRMFEVPPATPEEVAAVLAAVNEEGHEPYCPRHGKPVVLRRRGKIYVCPECGVKFS